jgi:uncharacterized protein
MKNRNYTFWLLGVCVVVFLIQLAIPGFTEMFDLQQGHAFEIWRFVTSIFLHASFVHIFYNMFALVIFGIMLEKLIGSNRFLIVFFATGIFGNLVAINFYGSSLGASGAIMGIIGALVLVRPMLTVLAFGMPMPMFIAGIIWAVGDILGAYGFLTGNPMDNTGNIAHLSGMFLGLVLGALFRDWSKRSEIKNRIVFDEGSVRKWEDVYLR